MGAVSRLRVIEGTGDGEGGRHPGGRPSKYEAWMIETVEYHLAQAYSMIVVAAVLDIAPSTLQEWLQKHAELAEAAQRGYAKGIAILEQRLLQMTIVGGGKDQFNALRLAIQNRVRALKALREEWVNPDDDDGKAVEPPQDLSALTDEELDQLDRLTAKLAAKAADPA